MAVPNPSVHRAKGDSLVHRALPVGDNVYQWFDCHLPGCDEFTGYFQQNAEDCTGIPKPLDSRRLISRLAEVSRKSPINTKNR